MASAETHRPDEGPRPGWVPEQLYPFESHYADVDGARVHYVDEGSGPTLLLLHGNPTWSFLYRDVIAGLRDRFRCIALDYPGFGLSRAAPGYGYTAAEHAGVVERLVQQLDLRDVTMIVQDWGGPIRLAAAPRQADRLHAFVLGNTPARPESDPAPPALGGVRPRQPPGLADGAPRPPGLPALPRWTDGALPDPEGQLLRGKGDPRQHEAQEALARGDGRVPRPVPRPRLTRGRGRV